MSKQCWYCNQINEQIADDFVGDFNCISCGVENDCLNGSMPDYQPKPQSTEEEWLNQKEGEWEMGELGKLARERSPFIRLAIGESSQPMIYKSWKEISGTFGDSFRYLFEVETEKGQVQKTFDCPQQKFAEQMDAIPFGSKVIIHRKQKTDGNGNPIENKSLYEAEEIRE